MLSNLPKIKEIFFIIYFRTVKLLGILDLKPVVFMHLQKTAGTSILQITRHLYGNDNTVSHGDIFLKCGNIQLPEKELFQTIGDMPFISGHFGYDVAKTFMEDRYSFTFLRDPVERVLSFYYFCRTRDPKQFRIYKLAQSLSLNDFLKLSWTDPEIRSHLWNYQVCQLACGWGGLNNVDLTDEKLLELAIQHIDEFSYVGFTETFEQDMKAILNDIGITIPVGMPYSNTNSERPKNDNLSLSSQKLLLELTELDRVLYEAAWDKKNRIQSEELNQ